MGQYEETKNELRAIKKGCICAIFFELIISALIFVFIRRPFTEPIYIIEKWWIIAFFLACILQNIVQIYKANVAIKNPQILIDI